MTFYILGIAFELFANPLDVFGYDLVGLQSFPRVPIMHQFALGKCSVNLAVADEMTEFHVLALLTLWNQMVTIHGWTVNHWHSAKRAIGH